MYVSHLTGIVSDVQDESSIRSAALSHACTGFLGSEIYLLNHCVLNRVLVTSLPSSKCFKSSNIHMSYNVGHQIFLHHHDHIPAIE